MLRLALTAQKLTKTSCDAEEFYFEDKGGATWDARL